MPPSVTKAELKMLIDEAGRRDANLDDLIKLAFAQG